MSKRTKGILGPIFVLIGLVAIFGPAVVANGPVFFLYFFAALAVAGVLMLGVFWVADSWFDDS